MARLAALVPFLLIGAAGLGATGLELHAATPAGEYCGDLHAPIRVDISASHRVRLHPIGKRPDECSYRLDKGGYLVLSPPGCGGDAGLQYEAATNSMLLSTKGGAPPLRLTQAACHGGHFAPWVQMAASDQVIRLPRLNVDPRSVITAGCSHAGDFATQFHIAFSSLVSGACVFSGQPYHCAVHRFARDYLVPQSPATGVPNCEGCPANWTLLYDHCKNHPQYVDVGELVDYPRRSCGQNPITHPVCIDDPKHLYDSRTYIFRPTHDRCYLPGAVENTAALYGMLMTDPAKQIKLVNDQPFPHTLPKNSTPYFNRSDPAGFDGPGECLRFVYSPSFGYEPLNWAVDAKQSNYHVFNQSEFMDDWGVGLQETGDIYIPTACQPDARPSVKCKLLFMLGVDMDFARYAESNNIVIVGMRVGGFVDQSRFPNACEVIRGLSDVYGQLSTDYAWQSGYQMRVGGRIVRRILGLD